MTTKKSPGAIIIPAALATVARDIFSYHLARNTDFFENIPQYSNTLHALTDNSIDVGQKASVLFLSSINDITLPIYAGFGASYTLNTLYNDGLVPLANNVVIPKINKKLKENDWITPLENAELNTPAVTAGFIGLGSAMLLAIETDLVTNLGNELFMNAGQGMLNFLDVADPIYYGIGIGLGLYLAFKETPLRIRERSRQVFNNLKSKSIFLKFTFMN